VVLARANNSMGKLFSKNSKIKVVQVTDVQPSKSVTPEEDSGMQRISRTFDQDLEIFLLNNILLSVQFFEDFER